MAGTRSRRGGPLVALAVVLGSWVAVRVVMTAGGGLPQGVGAPADQIDRMAQFAEPGRALTANDRTAANAGDFAGEPVRHRDDLLPPPRFAPPPSTGFTPFAGPAPDRADVSRQRPEPLPVNVAAGHHLMWAAALSRMPLPAGFASLAAAPRAVPSPFFPSGAAPAGTRRWSADGWLLLRREGGGSLAAGATPATYGASQAGAVLRYRLAPASGHRPEAYVRLTSALNAPADRQVAVGLSARPIARLPLRAMAELRLSDQVGGARLRPAALVVTELQPIDLPHETRAEFYGQAGYVGGRNATAFADGQARIDRQIAEIGRAELRAGAGAWAGAQKGAARIDAGPSAVLGVPLGSGGSARLGLDWRLRVAGDAQPGSGLALTLSAGF
jgi:hypothetical protein